ncbi:MAG: elongation factor G [Planctomycetes bacterium]|nr:elongation factor G [Planctomycetota bacterium]MBU1517337.1 elongation factor G [Planctomycetota bacterium]MBU2458441.1 elongation factor G [Planctomycetota bacterium]MBU2596942.1 elongation factor G [Planctomycetota bacterium]
MADINDIRNVALLGHGGAGKTSIAEAILHKTGKTNRLGTVEEKNTISDFDDEEKERSHSIHSAIMNTVHNGKTINLIDTPGYPDFIGAALTSIPVADCCVVVISASAGIEINTRKLYQAAEEAQKSRIIIINKLDSETADIPELIGTIQQTFGTQCRCANLPAADKESVIDCLVNSTGSSPVMDVAQAHTELVESAIEADDKLMETYLGGEQISQDKIAAVFAKAIAEGKIVPILFTNAKKEIGIAEFLDLITNYAPSPAQVKPAKLIDGEKITEIKADPAGMLAGLVFRVGLDPRSNMKYASIRIFSGTLKSDTSMLRGSDKKTIRPGHVLKNQGTEISEIPEGTAGDIITLAKLEELQIGDLIHDGKVAGKFEMPKVPAPMFSLALEPTSKGDEQKLGTAMEKLTEEDVCFKVSRDHQTHELVISGLGDLHLRVILSKMEKRFKLSVTTKKPKIPYRETITSKADGHYRHKKQTGGAGQFGEVYLRVEPAPRGSEESLQCTWDVFGGSIPGQFESPIIKGIQGVVETGVVAGFPMQDIKVSIYDGKHHPVDSKEVAFRAAGKGAFIDAVKKAKPCLLEPIVNIEITIPADHVGNIAGDLSSRRGRVQGQEMLAGNMMVLKALVPLSEVASYDSQLKSATGGQGSYSMTLSHYEVVPSNVQQQVVAQYAKEKEEEAE